MLRCAFLWITLLALGAAGQEPPAEEAGPVDLGKVLRESKEFREKCRKYRIEFGDGVVRAQGEIAYRGGGPCEYLINVFPAKAHETIVLLDKGERPPPPKEGEGEERMPEPLNGLAETLNNAFLAAGFRKGEALRWNDETGETFPPSGETVHLYAEWKDEKGGHHRARLSDWLWCWETIDPMRPGLYVFTGSVLIDEGPPDHKKWLGCEVDGLVAAVLNTSTAILDHREEGGTSNGAYEAIPARVPAIGTRVTCVFSRKELEVTENYEPLKLNAELEAEKKKKAEERAARDKEKAASAGK